MIFKSFCLFLIILSSLTLKSFCQEPSILETLSELKPAMVFIGAKNTQLFKTEAASVGVDPKTGRILVARKIVSPSYERSGAGIIIHPDGIIATNAHTVNKANIITVKLYDGTTVKANVITIIKGTDIALLKITTDNPLPAVALANSNKIALTQNIFTIGSSPLLMHTFTEGRVTGLGVNRTLERSGERRTDLIKTSINIYQGDSGGPLFNRKGELIGIMTADEGAADHSSFAIPSNVIKKSLLEYLNNH